MQSLLYWSLLAGCNTGTDVKIGAVNSPPSVTILSPGASDSFNEGELVHFQAKVQDSYDPSPELGFTWSSDLEGELLGGTPADSAGNITYSTANLSPGLHVITLSVLDSDAASSSASVEVEIIDLPDAPEITILSPSSGEIINEGDFIDLQVSVWDARDALDTMIVEMHSGLVANGQDPAEEDLIVVRDTTDAPCIVNPTADGMASCTTTFPALADVSGLTTYFLEFSVTNSNGYEDAATTYLAVKSVLDIDDDSDGFTENQGDCNDLDESIYPGAEEVENGIDDNCDDFIDEGTDAYDDDRDGFSENAGDCDDDNPNINPGVTEVCGDGIDNNCNGEQNEENATNCITFYRDADRDGYGDGTLAECWCLAGGTDGEFDVDNADDCYDDNALANPNQNGYFGVNRGDGSFDYNCDGTQTLSDTSSGECDSAFDAIASGFNCSVNTTGWHGSPPACGLSGNYIVDDDSCSAGCSFIVPTCCETGGPSYGLRVQTCN